MELQVDTSRREKQELRIGRDNQEIVAFRKASLFIHNLVGEFEGDNYQMKLAAPWNGFRYRLRRGESDRASAKRKRRMHAFEPDRPLVRHQLVEFELEIGGSEYRMTPEARPGLNLGFRQGDVACGRRTQRDFDQQKGAPWHADLEIPDDWGVPVAAFVAWLAREGRSDR